MVSSSARTLSIPRWVRAVELRAREVSAGADTEGDWAMVGTEVQQWVLLIPRSGVLVGMWQKP